MSPDLTQPVGLTSKRRFLRRLAEGVSQPPWSARAAVVAVVVSFGGIYGLPAVLSLLLPGGWHDADFLWPTLVEHLPLLVCLVWLARRAGLTVGTVFGLRGVRVGKVLVSGLLLFILDMLLMGAVGAGFEWLGFAPGTGEQEQARATAASFFEFTDTVVWTPLCEELACRALLYTALRTRLGIASSSIITAAVFVSMHGLDSIADAGAFFFAALLSSLWYERTRSLWPNIIDHALFNLVVTLAGAATKT
ncbi:MAG TPA: type II CAAX endopeptidase family protein [Bacillota bacterium]|nr:type II CAAX endopeptidase family protein [Bacillota bacterium]